MHFSEMNEHGREEPPDLAVLDFRQPLEPLHETSLHLVFGDGKLFQPDRVMPRSLVQARQRDNRDAGDDQQHSQHSERRSAAGPSLLINEFLFRHRLFQFSLDGQGVGRLARHLVFRVAGVFAVAPPQRLRRLDLLLGVDPDFPDPVSFRVNLVVDALGQEIITETTGGGFILEMADQTHS